jgi:carbohydrate kinase (thermoresistant glucokinase family)
MSTPVRSEPSSGAAASDEDVRLVVMGVSGCGKTTMATALAKRLGLEVVDGDDLHLPQSVAKMRSGIALEDADRWPWLDRIADYLAHNPAGSAGRVVACSALKRAYRDRIRSNAGTVNFLFLQGDFALIQERMSQRTGHYMQPGLLQSQFEALEIPQCDETDIITLSIAEPVEVLMQQAVDKLQAAGCTRT